MDVAADVELRGVRKLFRDVVAVDGVTLRVERGEFFSLLGPSGCGKTTTLRMIAGFEHPDAGDLLIRGRAMGDTPPFARNVNTVFQHYALFPHMSVAGNVGFGLRMAGAGKAEIARRVAESLALVRLGEYGDRRPRELSGGQQQRVALARALVNRPAVLLLDEPLGALDLKLRKDMQLELKRLQTGVGITFIYVTHDQEEALTMSDRIAVMNGGRVLQVGTPEEIYERPADRFVAGFIGESNFLDGVVRGLEPGRIVVEIDGDHPVMAPPPPAGGAALGERVTLAVRPENVRVAKSGARPAAAGGGHGEVAWLQGTVEQLVYLGADTQVLVRIGERAVVRARRPHADGPAEETPLAVGAAVAVGWTPGSARVLPR